MNVYNRLMNAYPAAVLELETGPGQILKISFCPHLPLQHGRLQKDSLKDSRLENVKEHRTLEGIPAVA